MSEAERRDDLDVICTAEEIQSTVHTLADDIQSDVGSATSLCVVGVLKGAFMFVADLVRALDLPVTVHFLGASSYGGRTSPSDEVRIDPELDEPIEGRDVLLVEDIVDTGKTAAKLRSYLAAKNPGSIRLCTMFRKPDRFQHTVDLDYVGLDIPDRFVVGYGMDYDEKYRHLPFLAVPVELEA